VARTLRWTCPGRLTRQPSRDVFTAFISIWKRALIPSAGSSAVAERLETLGVVILDLPSATSARGALAYAADLENRRKHDTPEVPRLPLPDFFIGAHASFLSLPLATADLGRLQTYFPELKLLTPPGTAGEPAGAC
jgi:predicted nucleic acid-binding protein